MKRILTLSLMLLTTTAFAEIEEGNVGTVTNFLSWKEYQISFPKRTTYRALTSISNQADAHLALDHELSDCNLGQVKVLLDIGTIAEADRTMNGTGKVEVMLYNTSWGGVHDFDYSTLMSSGSTKVILSINNFSWNGKSFYNALAIGSRVKLAFLINSRNILVEFPLDGFDQANKKASTECASFKALWDLIKGK